MTRYKDIYSTRCNRLHGVATSNASNTKRNIHFLGMVESVGSN